MSMLLALLMGHAIADFALQTDWIAKNKNRNNPIPEGYDERVHGPLQKIWPYVLSSHALIHGAMVWYITGNQTLGFIEVVSHWIIDFGKCEKWYGIHVDQALHIAFKIGYVLYLSV